MPGMRISLMTTSGCSRSRRAACFPHLKALALDARLYQGSLEHPAYRLSSSTTQTFLYFACQLSMGRKMEKQVSPGSLSQLEQAAVAMHDGLGDGQAQPRALGATADHGHEQRLAQVRGNARAVVDDIDAADQAVARARRW
jgi:hypothetical protein